MLNSIQTQKTIKRPKFYVGRRVVYRYHRVNGMTGTIINLDCVLGVVIAKFDDGSKVVRSTKSFWVIE